MEKEFGFKIGDWVAKDNGTSLTVGHITNKANMPAFGGLRIEFKAFAIVRGSFFEKLPKDVPAGYYGPSVFVDGAGLLDQFQDYSALIDLALATKDFDWLKELTEKGKNYETA